MRRIAGVSAKLLEVARKEFLEKGYEGANIREIAAKAETSSRAVYTRFANKEALFGAIVEPVAAAILQIHADAQRSYWQQAMEHPGTFPTDNTTEYLDIIAYAYEHYEETLLLLTKSKGTRYDNFLEELVAVDITSREDMIDRLDLLEFQQEQIQALRLFTKNLTVHFFRHLFDPIIHGMSHEVAVVYTNYMVKFYEAGVERLFILE